jgi:hypothetical protein
VEKQNIFHKVKYYLAIKNKKFPGAVAPACNLNYLKGRRLGKLWFQANPRKKCAISASD